MGPVSLMEKKEVETVSLTKKEVETVSLMKMEVETVGMEARWNRPEGSTACS